MHATFWNSILVPIQKLEYHGKKELINALTLTFSSLGSIYTGEVNIYGNNIGLES